MSMPLVHSSSYIELSMYTIAKLSSLSPFVV